jgi:hypothetical protein
LGPFIVAHYITRSFCTLVIFGLIITPYFHKISTF